MEEAAKLIETNPSSHSALNCSHKQDISQRKRHQQKQSKQDLDELLSSLAAVSSSSKQYNRQSQRNCEHQKAEIKLQPISESLSFYGESTLQGTPWEDALSSSSKSCRHKPDQKTCGEEKIVKFWQQFFG